MSDEKQPQVDPAVEAELAGVPEELLDKETDSLGEALDRLREDLDAAKQEVLYAKAETQNVRRRLEKDIADTRAYAATGFARDMLSVKDNLDRALTHVPEGAREVTAKFIHTSPLQGSEGRINVEQESADSYNKCNFSP